MAKPAELSLVETVREKHNGQQEHGIPSRRFDWRSNSTRRNGSNDIEGKCPPMTWMPYLEMRASLCQRNQRPRGERN